MSTYDWLILTVAPQREFAVRDDLHRFGIPAFVPVEFRWFRQARGKPPVPKRCPILPRYVFMAFKRENGIPWQVLHGLSHWQGALYADPLGRTSPAMLTQRQADTIIALSTPAKLDAAQKVRIGDKVRVKLGTNNTADLPGVVEAIKGANVVARVSLLGRTWSVNVPGAAVSGMAA